jgi:hypothetical protein
MNPINAAGIYECFSVFSISIRFFSSVSSFMSIKELSTSSVVVPRDNRLLTDHQKFKSK